jgi:hypothetical protein
MKSKSLKTTITTATEDDDGEMSGVRRSEMQNAEVVVGHAMGMGFVMGLL